MRLSDNLTNILHMMQQHTTHDYIHTAAFIRQVAIRETNAKREAWNGFHVPYVTSMNALRRQIGYASNCASLQPFGAADIDNGANVAAEARQFRPHDAGFGNCCVVVE